MFGIRPNSKSRRCFIQEDRGYGNQEFVIEKFDAHECLLRDPRTGQHFKMYTAHLYITAASAGKDRTERETAAKAIGKPKKKPGKR